MVHYAQSGCPIRLWWFWKSGQGKLRCRFAGLANPDYLAEIEATAVNVNQ